MRYWELQYLEFSEFTQSSRLLCLKLLLDISEGVPKGKEEDIHEQHKNRIESYHWQPEFGTWERNEWNVNHFICISKHSELSVQGFSGKGSILLCTQVKVRWPFCNMEEKGDFLSLLGHLKRVSCVLWEEAWHQTPVSKTNSWTIDFTVIT